MTNMVIYMSTAYYLLFNILNGLLKENKLLMTYMSATIYITYTILH